MGQKGPRGCLFVFGRPGRRQDTEVALGRVVVDEDAVRTLRAIDRNPHLRARMEE